MKMIGFQIEHDKLMVNSIKSNDIQVLTTKELNLIVEYLGKGEIVMSKTYVLFDNKNYISPYAIYTDGEWIWPSYFSYYLLKEKRINTEFLLYLKSKRFNLHSISEEKIRETIILLEKKMIS